MRLHRRSALTLTHPESLPDAPGESPGSDLAVEGIKRPASNQDAHGLPASAVNAESPIYYELGVRMWYVICSGFLFDVFI